MASLPKRSKRSGPEARELNKKSGSYASNSKLWRCAKAKMPKVTCPSSLCTILRAALLHKRKRSPRDHEEPLIRT